MDTSGRIHGKLERTDSMNSLGMPSKTVFRQKFSFASIAKQALEKKKLTEREKEKTDLKSKVAELEGFKDKYDTEKKENEILQARLQELLTGQSDATKNLLRTNENFDRLRLDHKKKVEQIEKMQRDMNFKDDRMRNLEIRASEVEKAELILESTKQNLEATITQVKVRDTEIKCLNKDLEECHRQMEIADHRISELEDKMEDMKIQVRHEIMKNENIEKNLETIPRLKDDIQERDGEIRDLRKHIEEKNALLAAARKAVREYKEKSRNTEQQIEQAEVLKQDLQLSQCEVNSLKRLMYGKDYLVTQKTKALDLSKGIINVLNDTLENDHVERIQHLIDRLSGSDHVSSRTDSSRSYGSVSSPSEPDFRCASVPPSRYRSSTPAPNHHYTNNIDINNYPYSDNIDSHSNPVVTNGNHGGQSHGNNHGNQSHGNSHGNQSHGNKRFLNQVLVDAPDKRKRPVSAIVPSSKKENISAVRRTSSYKEAHRVYTKPLPRKLYNYEDPVHSPRQNSYKSDRVASTKLKPSLDYGLGTEQSVNNSNDGQNNTGHSNSGRLENHNHKDNGHARTHHSLSDTDSDSGSDLEGDTTLDSGGDALDGLNAREKDKLMAQVLNVGDRVLICTPQKQPRYGKKRVLKPINYTGIVKYKGKLNPEKYDARIYAGVRMDEQIGDTNGMYKGKRLMYTPADQGKFYKLRELTSVLNLKTGKYIPIQRLMVHYLHKQERYKHREDHQQ